MRDVGTHALPLPSRRAARARRLKPGSLLRGRERNDNPGTQLFIFHVISSCGKDMSSKERDTFEQQLTIMGMLSSALFFFFLLSVCFSVTRSGVNYDPYVFR